MGETLNKIFELDFTFLIYIILELVVLGGIYLWSKTLSKKWRTVINLGIVILLVRIILFQNPAAWYFYNETLDPEVIGWRQHSVLYDKFVQYQDHNDVKYLALGSSQTGALYRVSEDSLSHFEVKSLAGLGPLDFYMYRHEILNYNPQKIFLYLSDFDIGRPPALTSLKLSPNQGFSLPMTYWNLQEKFSSDKFQKTMKSMVVGELFPEYKYAYIFQGYIDQLFNKNKVFPTAAARMSAEDREEYQFRQLREVISKKNIDTNMYYLNKFITFFKKHDINITIMEGQYNPNAYTERNLAVKREVRQEFNNLSQKYRNVNFLPKSKLVWFEASDFTDAYHVKRRAAKEFLKRIRNLTALQRSDTK